MAPYQQEQIALLLRRWREQGRLGTPRGASGPRNSISDVAGVRVGHATLAKGETQTGVTAIVPAGSNLFAHPLPCGAAVLNGFAKPVGLVQIEELGLLQTPILLSNTLAVGTLFTALARDAIAHNPELGRTLPTVNPLALECNDGWLNDIQALAVTEHMAREALECAEETFERGSVGAGRGMSCFGLKGGIGTASRRIPELGATLGVLVLANFGALSALTLDGVQIGEAIAPLLPELAPQQDAGSIIIIMATDAPLDARQLKRIAKRAGAGLGRLGSYWGHGSGDISVAFSTCPQPQPPADNQLEPLLSAAADATEHAVLDALLSADAVTGFRGHYRPALRQVLDRLVKELSD
ncbi:P1 family peptidase [Brenneria izadpanahii]|uniref:P1 family peptidase n=1 Tax=Brenneria izadpanahii TaxID=2722756 RepID=A0ABX7UM74_9GAMM|nr:P1 family peptidase [Brenneria izadpanahii]QTF06629.1 P1 family peptidase [Brenneria izadpanahii]